MPQIKPLRSVSLWGSSADKKLWSGEGALDWSSAASTSDSNSYNSEEEEEEENKDMDE